ncbi:MAG: AAA family ATPase [Planctomycetota bacterium]
MQFLDIMLKPFGKFKEESIQFTRPESKPSGFFMVVGPNEAGKSTTLAAIGRFLFGFQKKDVYNINRDKNLWVGATLELHDGKKTFVWRKDTQKKTLFLSDQKSELPENLLERMLVDVKSDQYMQLYGLGQENLREGGKKLVKGEGDFADILFGESLGDLSQFEKIRKKLNDRADELFKPKARGAVNAPLNSIKSVRDTNIQLIKDAETTQSDWMKKDYERKKCESKIESLKREIKKIDEQWQRLDRMKQSVELIEERLALIVKLESMSSVPSLIEAEENQFVEYRTLFASLKSQIKDKEDRIHDLDETIKSIRLNEKLLENGNEISTLGDEVSAIEKCKKNHADLNSGIQEKLLALRQSLTDLGYDPDFPDQVPYLDSPKREHIQSIGRSLSRNQNELNQQKRTLELAERELEELELELKETPQTDDLDRMNVALLGLQGLQAESSKIDNERKNLKKMIKSRDRLISDLPLWNGNYEKFRSLHFTLESLKADESTLVQSEINLGVAERSFLDSKNRHESADEILQEKISQLKLPTLDDLKNARNLRDETWNEIRTEWLSDLKSVQTDRVRISERFTQEMGQVDQYSDRLREYAEIAAEMLQVKTYASESRAAEVKLNQARLAAADAKRKWQGHFSFLESVPDRPEEVRPWETIGTDVFQIDEKIEASTLEIEEFERKWIAFYQLHIETDFKDSITETCSVDLSVQILNDLKGKRIESSANFKNQSDLRSKSILRLKDLKENIESLKSRLAEDQEKWLKALNQEGLRAEMTPENFESNIIMINQWKKDWQSFQGSLDEIKQGNDEIARYDQSVHELAHRIGFPEDIHSASVTVRNMQEALNKERNAESILKSKRSSRTDELKNLEELGDRNRSTMALIKKILERIQVESIESASEIFDQIKNKSDTLEKVRNHETGLSLLCLQTPLKEWIESVNSKSLLEMNDDIDLLKERKAEREKLKEIDEQNLGVYKSDLRNIDEKSIKNQVCEFRNKQDLHLQETKNKLRDYIKFRLTNLVLEEASKAYKKETGDKVLELASSNIKALTSGSIEALRTEPTDDGGYKILALRKADDPDSDELEHKQLSEGTRDQLFLALKLAMIENRLDERKRAGHCPLPVIFDDILVNFDDERAAAAFRLFSKLSEKTQVIFLTHHQHLEAVAKRTIGDVNFGVHRLGGNIDDQFQSSAIDQSRIESS